MSLDTLLMELAQQGVQVKLTEDARMSVSAPKGALSDGLRLRLSEHKAALIAWLQGQHEQGTPESLPVITPDPAHRHDPFPMAELQASFYIGQNEDMEFHVRPHTYLEKDFDQLDVQRFETALNAVLHRQRYNLPIVTADLQLQIPRSFTPLTVRLVDLRYLSDAQAQEQLLNIRERMSRELLPLEHWPTEDVCASLYAGERVRLHINHNNFFGDGYGTMKLLAAVMDYYRDPQPLPELSLSFRDCVLALAQLEASPLGQISKKYWEDRLPDLPGPPPLPRAAGKMARVRSQLSSRKFKLAPSAWMALKQRAGQFGITPSNVLTAVYAEVVSQWSGSRHFLLNHMVTHRFPMHPEIMEIYGNFASLYPLEVDWRAGAPFYQRAQRLQERLMSDMRHLYWSGMKVLQALNQVQKTPGRAPCPFVVGSGLFIKDWEELFFSCLETPQVLLDYQYWELADGTLLIAWDLLEDFFPAGLIDGMQGAFEALLAALANDESAWFQTSFDLLPAAQREQRAALNATRRPLPDGLLHSGLARSAISWPRKPALVSGNRTLTYAQLNDAANRLGHCLRKAGARPNQLIAVLHDRGVEQVLAAFGILASGAAYVPIDPRWPQERIHLLLAKAKVQIVVTSRAQALPVLPQGVSVIYVDQADLAAFPATPMIPAQNRHDLAYVIFTSGSTGMPKGVMIDHLGALNTVTDINERCGVSQDDCLFGISSLYFDLSVYDMFGAAVAGATLVLPPAMDDPNPAMWIDAVRRHGVTVWNSVPALAQLLVDAAQAGAVSLPSLRQVMLSGDWIPLPLPEQLRQVAPQVRIISLGGATEASIWSIAYRIDCVDPAWPSIPYGKPLANQHWHILDDNGEDAPVWVPGHLYIGGDGLALAYCGDEEKTRAAFISHPRTGIRLYRSGDRGRYLADGHIEFLGRTDLQVKIQGYRVELGEIETVLSQHAAVRSATVIASSCGAGKQLIAFVVPHTGQAIDPASLVEYLRSKLPGYMLPSHILPLAQLPLTANGKVDRGALASLGPSAEPAREFIAPRTDSEKALAAIWEQVLNLRPIGVRDDFFELGGQSFAAVRVMTRIAQQYGRRLPLSVLLEERTIEALARQLHARQAWSPLVQLRADGAGLPCFFVHPAGGNVLCYRGLAEKLGAPFYALQAAGLSGEQPAPDSIEQMATLYLAAIQAVRPCGPYLLGGWSSGGMIAFEMARQLEAQGAHVAQVLMLDAPPPMQHSPVDDATLLRWFHEDFDLDPGLDAQQMGQVLSVFTHIVRAGRRYRPSPIDADICVVRATQGQVSEFADHPAVAAPDWGWSQWTRGRTSSVDIPGTHYTILSEPHVDMLAARLLDLPERIRHRYRQASVVSLGGATEAAIWSIYYPVNKVDPGWASIPYGRPLPNQMIWVLDQGLRPCPDQVQGRIYIGGIGLALGYWRDAGKSAARFITHPSTGERLYDTGDLGRYDLDGNVVILGRDDGQIKIRGHRVELGEVEAVLRQFDQVEHAIVLPAAVSEARQLVAYLVPRHFVQLDALPVSANGKIDYQALPPVSDALAEHEVQVMPRDELEHAIFACWSRVIVDHPFGVTCNFFELGGDSILATRLVRELNADLSLGMEIHDLFENLTIEEMAAWWRRRVAAQPSAAAHAVSNDQDAMLADIRAGVASVSSLQFDPDHKRLPVAPRVILLTGASGWVGSHLLAELLSETMADICCLVRGSTDGAARLIEAMRQNGIAVEPSWHARIMPFRGDLSEPGLGLDASDRARLAASVESIYHLGASLNILADYATHRRHNVAPIVPLLQLAAEHHLKPVFYLSPMTVCRRYREGHLHVLHEERPQHDHDGLLSAYAQSKWAAEQILLAAAGAGMPVKIYRTAHALPTARAGVAKPNDTYVNVLRAACAAGLVPDWASSRLYGVPVDTLARLIVDDALAAGDRCAIVHIDNHDPLSLASIVALLLDGRTGTPPPVAVDEWLARCREAVAGMPPESAALVGALFAHRESGVAVENMFAAHPLDTTYFTQRGQAAKLAKLAPPAYWRMVGRRAGW